MFYYRKADEVIRKISIVEMRSQKLRLSPFTYSMINMPTVKRNILNKMFINYRLVLHFRIMKRARIQ